MQERYTNLEQRMKLQPAILKGVKLVNHSISSQNETVNSWWNAGLFSGYNKEGIGFGYLENKFMPGTIIDF